MNRVERMMQELPDDGLPQTGFEIDPGRTALVITDRRTTSCTRMASPGASARRASKKTEPWRTLKH